MRKLVNVDILIYVYILFNIIIIYCKKYWRNVGILIRIRHVFLNILVLTNELFLL
jgi:hypothetical protein